MLTLFYILSSPKKYSSWIVAYSISAYGRCEARFGFPDSSIADAVWTSWCLTDLFVFAYLTCFELPQSPACLCRSHIFLGLSSEDNNWFCLIYLNALDKTWKNIMSKNLSAFLVFKCEWSLQEGLISEFLSKRNLSSRLVWVENLEYSHLCRDSLESGHKVTVLPLTRWCLRKQMLCKSWSSLGKARRCEYRSSTEGNRRCCQDLERLGIRKVWVQRAGSKILWRFLQR